MNFDRRKLNAFDSDKLKTDLQTIVEKAVYREGSTISQMENEVLREIRSIFAAHRKGITPTAEDRERLQDTVKLSLREMLETPSKNSKPLQFSDEVLTEIVNLLLSLDSTTITYLEQLRTSDRVTVGDRGAFSVIATLLENPSYLSLREISNKTGSSVATIRQTHIPKAKKVLVECGSGWTIVGDNSRGWKLRKENEE